MKQGCSWLSPQHTHFNSWSSGGNGGHTPVTANGNTGHITEAVWVLGFKVMTFLNVL